MWPTKVVGFFNSKKGKNHEKEKRKKENKSMERVIINGCTSHFNNIMFNSDPRSNYNPIIFLLGFYAFLNCNWNIYLSKNHRIWKRLIQSTQLKFRTKQYTNLKRGVIYG